MLTKLKLNWADPGRSQQLVISVKTKPDEATVASLL